MFAIYPITLRQNQKTCIAAKSKLYFKNILQKTILLFIKVESWKFEVPTVKNIPSPYYEQYDGHLNKGLDCPSVEIEKFRYF